MTRLVSDAVFKNTRRTWSLHARHRKTYILILILILIRYSN